MKNSRLHKTQYVSIDDKYGRLINILRPSFERIEPVASLVVYADGTTGEWMGLEPDRPILREFMMFHCYGFKIANR